MYLQYNNNAISGNLSKTCSMFAPEDVVENTQEDTNLPVDGI